MDVQIQQQLTIILALTQMMVHAVIFQVVQIQLQLTTIQMHASITEHVHITQTVMVLLMVLH